MQSPILYDDVHHTLMQMGFTKTYSHDMTFDARTGTPLPTMQSFSEYRRKFDGISVKCNGTESVIVTAPACYPVTDCDHRKGLSTVTVAVRPDRPGMFRDSLEAAILAAARLGVIEADAGLIDTTVQPTVRGCGCGGCA